MSIDVISCPKCGSRIPVSRLLTEQIRAEMEGDFAERLRTEQVKLREQSEAAISKERSRIETDATRKAEAKNRSEMAQSKQEAKNLAASVQKLTAQLEAKERTLEADVAKRLERARKQLEADIS